MRMGGDDVEYTRRVEISYGTRPMFGLIPDEFSVTFCIISINKITPSRKTSNARRNTKKILVTECLQMQCPPMQEPLFSISPSHRQDTTNLSFLSNISSGGMDCPPLHSFINFKTPARPSRFSANFHFHFSHSNYQSNSPLIRLMRVANESPSIILLTTPGLSYYTNKPVYV